MNRDISSLTDVKQAIQETLTRENIGSLDELVTRVASLTLDRDQEEDPLVMLTERSREARSTDAANKSHQPPQALLFIDNERYEPEQISEFDGRALCSTPGLDAKREPALYSFTTPSKLKEHLAATARREEAAVSNLDSLPSSARYAEHSDQEGDWLWNGPGRAWRNLTRVSRGIFGLSDWNDVISSVDWCRWDISLYEDADYQGSQLYLPAGRNYNKLADFGWEDRASATVNWGQRF